jgi:hypothetical protein
MYSSVVRETKPNENIGGTSTHGTHGCNLETQIVAWVKKFIISRTIEEKRHTLKWSKLKFRKTN